MAHIHAALMAEYAKDAAETDEPWTRWEYLSGSGEWVAHCAASPSWAPSRQYRRKPQPAPTKILYQWAILSNSRWMVPDYLYESEEAVLKEWGPKDKVHRLDHTAIEVPA